MINKIRLNKVLREFNVSLDRVVDFLKTKGYEIDARPTTKISDEIYEVLYDEFKTDKSKRRESREVSEDLKREKKEMLRLAKQKELEIKKEAEEKNKSIQVENENHNLKSIAFKNFRRFENFPKLQFGNITYMVGRNNSGKSTLVKALLLITDYLQNQLSDTFSFDNEVLEDANIVTFGRAKNNITKEQTITFDYRLNEFYINIAISGKDENTRANVVFFKVFDFKTGINLDINYLEGNITISKEGNDDEEEKVYDINSNILKQLKESETELKQELQKITEKTTEEAINLINDYKMVEKKLKDAKKLITNKTETKKVKQYELTYPVDYVITKQGNNQNLIILIIENFIRHTEILSTKNKKEISIINNTRKKDDTYFNEILNLKRSNSHLTDFSKKLTQTINSQYFYFIGANPSKQSALFYLRDKNNALAQAIHNFYQLTAGEKNNEETRFIKYWMKEFEVGKDFSINMQAGEAYEFKILEEEPKIGESEEEILKRYVSLSDKGMGSLQAMTLILKMAGLIRLNEKEKKQITVLVEEPELNLHPALQSKLTDFFHDIHTNYGFDFIIETHSEYVIRRSQLLALEKNYLSDQGIKSNPFSVFYFHKEEGPYEMKFTEKGNFERSFGKGFYNVNDDLAMELAFKANGI